MKKFLVAGLFSVFMLFQAAPGAQAVVMEYPIESFTHTGFHDYLLSGIIRADVNGELFSFSPANYPLSPASVIALDPLTSTRQLVIEETASIYDEEVCFFSVCGGVRVIANVDVYHVPKPYRVSLSGEINTLLGNASVAPVPQSTDFRIEIVTDTTIQFTGLLNDIPDFLKDPLVAAANGVASAFGDGTILLDSSVAGVDPLVIELLINEQPAFLELTVNWEDVRGFYTNPVLQFNGSTSFETLTDILGFFGVDSDDQLAGLLLQEIQNAGNCPSGSDPNCVLYESQSLTFRVPVSRSPMPGIPEPGTAVMLLLAGTLFAVSRRLKG